MSSRDIPLSNPPEYIESTFGPTEHSLETGWTFLASVLDAEKLARSYYYR